LVDHLLLIRGTNGICSADVRSRQEVFVSKVIISKVQIEVEVIRSASIIENRVNINFCARLRLIGTNRSRLSRFFFFYRSVSGILLAGIDPRTCLYSSVSLALF
jgi:hypothetical protein